MLLVLYSVNSTEFVVPRTSPFSVPANITHGCNHKEFVHAVQSNAINLVGLSIDHGFDRLCRATSRHKFTSVTVVDNPNKNVAVAKSDSVAIVSLMSDSAYDVKKSEHQFLAEGYDQAHECTEGTYSKNIQGADGSTTSVPESITPTDATDMSSSMSDWLSNSQSAQGGLPPSPLPSAAMCWPDIIPIAKESSDSSASNKTLVAEPSASLPSSTGPLGSLTCLTCQKKKGGSLPSHPPHRERRQVSPSSTGKPPPLAGDWEEPQQETPWELDTEIADPMPQIETMPPVIKPFTPLAGEDVSRSCSKWFSDAEKREASVSSAPLRFVSYLQSPRQTFAFHDREDSGYGSASATQSASKNSVMNVKTR